MNYSPLQAMTFYLLANERTEQYLKNQAATIRMAVWAEKDFEKWLLI